jgi:Flp pilus assembly protein TadD
MRPFPYGTVPLVRFRNDLQTPAEELDRDLGVALSRYARLVPPNEAASRGDPRALAVGRLKAALARWATDAEGWEALADARPAATEAGEKLKAARRAVELAPRSESALAVLTEAAAAAGQFALAVETADQWVALAPRSAEPLIARAFVQLKRSDWGRAEADCRAALAINPLHAETRLYLAICLHHRGDPAGGKKEAEAAAKLEASPQARAGLLDWYRRATR